MLWTKCDCACFCNACGGCPHCFVTPRFIKMICDGFGQEYADNRNPSNYWNITCRDGYPQFPPPLSVPCNTCEEDFGERTLQLSGSVDLIKWPNDNPPWDATLTTVPLPTGFPVIYPPWTSPLTGQTYGEMMFERYKGCNWFAYTQCCIGTGNVEDHIHIGSIGLRIIPLVENSGYNYMGTDSPWVSVGGVCGADNVPEDMPCFTHLGFFLQLKNFFVPTQFYFDPLFVTTNYIGVHEREDDCGGEITLDRITADDYYRGLSLPTVGGTAPGIAAIEPAAGPFTQAATGCLRSYYDIGGVQHQDDSISPSTVTIEATPFFVP